MTVVAGRVRRAQRDVPRRSNKVLAGVEYDQAAAVEHGRKWRTANFLQGTVTVSSVATASRLLS